MTESSLVFKKTTGVDEPRITLRDSVYYWQLWHHNWDDSDISFIQYTLTPVLERRLNILEIGCGDGRVAFNLAVSGHEITGIDIEEKFIAIAKRRLENSRCDNVKFLVMDGQNLTFPDRSFDVALFPWSLQFMQNACSAVSEIHRVLKPGGQMLVIGLLSGGDYDRAIQYFVPNAPIIKSHNCYFEPIEQVFGKTIKSFQVEECHYFNYLFESASIAYDAFLFAFKYWHEKELSSAERDELKKLINEFAQDGKVKLRFPATICVVTK